MPKLTVKYTVEYTETIDWPEDEVDALNFDNLACNLNPEESACGDVDISSVLENGLEYDF